MPLAQRLGLIGDIHAEDELLEQAIHRLTALGAERLLAVGDVADGQGDLDRCVRLLEQHRVLCVRGNHDRWLVAGSLRSLPHAHRLDQLAPDTRRYLASLVPELTLDTTAGRLLLCHGLGPHDMASVSPHEPDEHLALNDPLQELLLRREHDLIVNGHSHHPMDRRVRGVRGGSARILNAGTLERDQQPCCVFVDLALPAAQFLPLSPPTR